MTRRRRHRGLFAGCIAVAAVAVGLAAALVFERGEPEAALPSLRRSAAADRVFADALPAFAIALDAARRGDGGAAAVDRAGADLRRAAEALPGPVAAELAALVQAARDAAAGGDGTALLAATTEVNAALAGAGLAYRIDANVVSGGGRRAVLLFSFAVDEAAVYASGDRRAVAVRASRIDGLNWRYVLLGFTGAHMQEALVLAGQIEARAVALAPALSGALAPEALGAGEAVAREPYWAPLAAAAAAGIAADLRGRVDEALGALVAERRELVAAWNERLAARGLALSPPTTLELAADAREAAASVAEDGELARLDAIAAELAAPSRRRAFASLQEILARSVERHEVQHLLDRAAHLPVPAPLSAYVGDDADPSFASGDVATVALAELSAYLAEVARGDLPHLQLAVLAGYLIEPSMWGTGESYAALVIADQLAAELGLEDVALVERRRIQPDRAAARYAELLAVDGQRLAEAARRRWQALFARPLPAIELSGRVGLDR